MPYAALDCDWKNVDKELPEDGVAVFCLNAKGELYLNLYEDHDFWGDEKFRPIYWCYCPSSHTLASFIDQFYENRKWINEQLDKLEIGVENAKTKTSNN